VLKAKSLLEWSTANIGIVDEAERQRDRAAILGAPNEIHAQTEHDADAIRDILEDKGIDTPVIHDPTPVIKR
jgi:hypothetical protein